MIYRYLILLTAAITLIGCNQKSPSANSASALSWKEENIVVKESGCNGAGCGFADFRYITFSGSGADSLNKQVLEIMGSSFMDDSLIVTTPKISAEKFIAVFEDYKNEFPDEAERWMLDREIRPDTLFENVISLRYDESSYSGGAHGMYFTIYNHYQISPFKSLWLVNFLNNPADTLQISKIAEAIFCDKEELSFDENLKEAGYFFEGGVFKLNENFHFTAEGLEFHFNIYEIQPYVSGEYQLLLPYEKITPFIKASIFKGVAMPKPVS